MFNKKILTAFLFTLLVSFSFEAFAGELVWGPKKYVWTSPDLVDIYRLPQEAAFSNS